MTHPRSLTFSTTYNFRDVGGYAGLDGREVRWRQLFRSDSLHRLRGDDLQTFGELGIRTVIDLRRTREIERHGRVPDAAGLTYHNPVIEHVDWETVPEPTGLPRARWLADRYLNFAEDGHAGLAAALGLIADPQAAPVVVHCMAGKDRTGVVCALTLSLLGVSDADIAEDYALTEASMVSLSAYLQSTSPDMVQDKYHMFECPQDAMLMFLDDLRARHGSVEAYVRDIGITAEQVTALRDHLLDPA
ncbi:tyrosine-protein phosphatase [Actinoplanes sp. N902-109]|uniref:tyrosine-protein phosphatase n=1 Tax=Actinoplanes sp. (strain N902-109) TaxID=649831 RepID=UPI0003293F26|nr:tyrosine-protein phosphatase [Actinoplanes sp. N902-109]AGL20469.1 tyrosine/serine phosphatase [Actinoplanes sp. N902-109]